MSADWSLSDAWVLTAIHVGRQDDGTVSLERVIAVGDAINHAILTESELEAAIPRLVAARLIEVDDSGEGFAATEAGRELVTRCTRGRGLFAWIDTVPPALTRLGLPPEGTWFRAADAYARATDGYRRRSHRR